MPTSRHALLLITALTIPLRVHAQAQDTLAVGQHGFPRVVLHAGTTTEQLSMESNGTTRLGPRTITDVREVVSGGEPAYLVVVSNTTPRGTAFDSVWVSRATFAMIRHIEGGPGPHTEASVRNGHVLGTIVDTASAQKTYDVLGPVLDFTTAKLAYGSLPLRDGYATHLRVFDISGDMRTIGVKVIGMDTVTTPAGPRKAWRVDVDYGARKITMWLDQETKQGVQWKTDLPGGAVMWSRQM